MLDGRNEAAELASGSCDSDREALPLFTGGAKGKTTVVRRSEWYQTTALLVGEVMGTGVLSLPYACAKLGWALGLTSLAAFAGTAVYSGLLLSRVQSRFFPEAASYAELARRTGGVRFECLTRLLIITTWCLLLVYFLVAAVDAAMLIVPPRHACFCAAEPVHKPRPFPTG